jgi:hypothetical protein
MQSQHSLKGKNMETPESARHALYPYLSRYLAVAYAISYGPLGKYFAPLESLHISGRVSAKKKKFQKIRSVHLSNPLMFQRSRPVDDGNTCPP